MELRIVLVSKDSQLNRELKTVLSEVTGNVLDGSLKVKVFEGLPSMEEAVVHFAPHLIIIHFEADAKHEKMAFLDQLSRISERIPIIISSAELSSDFMLTCIKKGARDFLKEPIQETELEMMLKRLLHEGMKGAENTQLATTYTFFSYKGGIGTTFISSNTAVALQRLTGARVLIWDLVIQNGDISFFFDYEPTSTLTDILENISKIDASYLSGVLPVHSSGVSILPAPKRPEEAESVRTDQIQLLHQTLRKFYDYIFVDAGRALTDPVISVMDHSKYIFLTTDLHLPVLKNTLRCLEVFERLGYVEGKFKILLNRYASKYEKFDMVKAEEILHYPVSYTISNDYVTASRSLNAGIPTAELDSNSVLAKQFSGLAKCLLHDFKTEERRPSLIKRLLGGGGGKKSPKPAKNPAAVGAEEKGE